MIAGGGNKLPYGNFPRLILAWLCTETVRTQSRVLVLGRSLAKFMKTLGVYSSGGGRDQIKLRNQMRRLFGCSVQLSYKEENVERFVNSYIAESGEYWWNPQRPKQSLTVGQQDRTEREFLQRDYPPSRPDRHEHPHGPEAMFSGPRFLPVAHLPHLYASCSATDHLETVVPAVRLTPLQSQRQAHRPKLPLPSSARAKEDQAGLAGPELRNGSGRPDPASLNTDYRAAQSRSASELVSLFPAQGSPPDGLASCGCPLWGVLKPLKATPGGASCGFFPQVPVVSGSFPRAKRIPPPPQNTCKAHTHTNSKTIS